MNAKRISKALAAGQAAAIATFAGYGAAPGDNRYPIWGQIVLALTVGAVTGVITYRAPKNADPQRQTTEAHMRAWAAGEYTHPDEADEGRRGD